MTAEDQHLLLWKGRQFGPFSVEQIREKLLAGDINRMHQIHAAGRWQILDEYLERLRGADLAARHADEQRTREEEMKRQFEAQFNQERASLSQPNAQGPHHASALQSSPGAAGSPFGQTFADPVGAGAVALPFPPSQSRTSGFAITALVMGVCNFIPFVNFVSWILALVFGHIALSQMNADESLKGRGLAIAGLAITYFLLVMITTVVALCLANNRPLPIHF